MWHAIVTLALQMLRDGCVKVTSSYEYNTVDAEHKYKY